MSSSPVFTQFTLRDLTLRNRVVRSAAFEGMSQGGAVTEPLIAYHREVSAGGVGMTTVAYASVSPDGRTYDHQLLMRPEILPGLRRLTDAVHAEGAAAAIQLGHCGYFANREVTGVKPMGPSRVFNTYGLGWPRVMTEEDMERVADDFARAAVLAREGGFDAVELHAGHGYLLSQFLSPHTNRRRDAYGGSLENRLRFPVKVVRWVREAVGPACPVLAKMNVQDGFPGGQTVEDAEGIARAFEAEGVDCLILSGGFVSKTPMYVMRGEVPFKEMYAGQASRTKKVGLLLMGRILVKAYPYEDGYFLPESRRIRRAVKLPLMVVGGVRALDQMESILAEGFELLAMARPLIMEPDLIGRMERGEATASRCEPCNKCIAEMDHGGMRCTLLAERLERS